MEACGAAGWSVERPGPLSGAVCAVVQVVGVAAARRKALVEAVTNMYLPKNPVVPARNAVVTKVG